MYLFVILFTIVCIILLGDISVVKVNTHIHSDFQVGELSSPINFKSLIGFDDYQEQLYKRYPKNAWMTPS